MRSRLLLLAAVLVGCSSSVEPATPPSIEGPWVGTTAVGTQVVLSISQRGDSISGAGYFFAGGTTYVGIPNITGSFAGVLPLRFVLESGVGPVTFSSPLYSHDSLPGTLAGSGFTGERLTLRRR